MSGRGTDDLASRVAEFIRAQAGDRTLAPTGPTFRELWTRYFREEGRKNSTADDIERMGALLLEQWGDLPAISVTTAVAEDFADTMRARVTCKGTPFRPATINRHLTVGRRCLQWAIEQRPQLLPFNPLSSVKLAKENNVRQIGDRTEADLQLLLAHANAVERAAVLLYVDSGARRLEILSVQWDQVYLAKIKTDDGWQTSPAIHLWATKNGEQRRIGISWRAYEALRALPRLDRYVFVGRCPGVYKGREAPIRPGTHLTPDMFLKRFKRLCAKAGVFGPDGKPLTIHDLRHWFVRTASIVYQIPDRSVMLQTGHKTRSAFERYGIGGDYERAAMMTAINKGIQRELNSLRMPAHKSAHQDPTYDQSVPAESRKKIK